MKMCGLIYEEEPKEDGEWEDSIEPEICNFGKIKLGLENQLLWASNGSSRHNENFRLGAYWQWSQSKWQRDCAWTVGVDTNRMKFT